MHGGQPVRIEHWDVAFNHGKTAALNMLGKDVPHEVVPYFFSDLGDWGGLEYVGPAYGWDEEIVRGSIEGASFTNFYLQDGASRRRSPSAARTISSTPVDCSPTACGSARRIAGRSPTPAATWRPSAADRAATREEGDRWWP